MMRRLLDAVVRPTVSYGCEVWGTLSAGRSVSEIKQMTDIQLAFFRQTLQLRKAVPAPVIFAEMEISLSLSRERFHYVHAASMAHEDESLFMSICVRMATRKSTTAF